MANLVDTMGGGECGRRLVAQGMIESGEGSYVSDSGYVMRRENGNTPNGNPIAGRWVLRSPEGEWVDFDQYRSDLAERNGFKLS